jgi:hypothetical protein
MNSLFCNPPQRKDSSNWNLFFKFKHQNNTTVLRFDEAPNILRIKKVVYVRFGLDPRECILKIYNWEDQGIHLREDSVPARNSSLVGIREPHPMPHKAEKRADKKRKLTEHDIRDTDIQIDARDDFVCPLCNGKGHTAVFCSERDKHISKKRFVYKSAHGIPRDQLRPLPEKHSGDEIVYKTADGQVWLHNRHV